MLSKPHSGHIGHILCEVVVSAPDFNIEFLRRHILAGNPIFVWDGQSTELGNAYCLGSFDDNYCSTIERVTADGVDLNIDLEADAGGWLDNFKGQIRIDLF
jgi:hypothetical protein